MTHDTKQSARGRLKLSPAKDLRKYTQQIWLAGLGAFSRAEEEGGKLFDNLVQIGEELEHKTRDLADNAAEEIKDKVIEKASDTREKVERVIDDRLSSTLSRLGIPSQKDIESLTQRMDNLTRVIEQLALQLDKKK
ncbi:poly(hydroxyalkanoate) granule-associated protein [Paraperlucidibaca baekdonensis]|uniref:Poly(Hydroxyalkanoate) granule-associated protein n=1 Tax=Paraperlucidibaca baekdonensis TaxID=748120 RepID=A0A3E0H5S0_9GAMM|nr:phasin family protein [Paraperlucidibaca baekdonensis]REH37950.1 poly(hydroxyalkanoate) granule-associated protein [Paraperlucidibaca baekdonensis]